MRLNAQMAVQQLVVLEAMSFHKPIKVGDVVSNYARVIRVGRTSITVEVMPAVERQLSGETIVVTEGLFTYCCC